MYFQRTHLAYSSYSTESFSVGASLVAEMAKNLPAMQETWVRSLGWGNPLEKGRGTHFSTLAQRIPWTEEPVSLCSNIQVNNGVNFS